MFEIALLAFLSYRNSVKAKLKGLNGTTWGFITAGAYLCALMVGGMVVIFGFCRNLIDINSMSSTDVKMREAAAQQLFALLSSNWLYPIAIELFGIGGYLLVLYIIDSKPDKKTPEIHWMDRMGNEDQ